MAEEAQNMGMTSLETYQTHMPACRECGARDTTDPRQTCAEYANLPAEEAAAAWLRDHEGAVKAFGPAIARLAESMLCQACLLDHHKTETTEERERRAWRVYAQAYGTGDMPADAKAQRFDKSDPFVEHRNQAAWDWARAWDRRTSVWVCGDRGTGKTYLARCMCNETLEHAHTALEVRARSLDERAKGYGAEQRIAKLIQTRCLLIDDIDKAVWSREGVSALHDIIDRRRAADKPTLITANVKPEKMLTVWRNLFAGNDAVVVALFDRMSGWHRMEMTGESLRRVSA